MADNAKHGEIPPMNHNAPEIRSSLQHQTSRLSNEKVTSRRNIKSLKPGMAIEQNGPDQDTASAVTVMPLGNHPSRKVMGVDDVVKYMSSVPSYLQRLEKGDSVQEKALNFGVLDWGRLEKWTCLQKQEANRRRGDSPSSSCSSATASFSTFGSSSHYTRSTESSSYQRKQSFEMNARRNSSVEDWPTESINEQKSVQVMNNCDSEASRNKPAEKVKGRHSNVNGISIDKPQPQDVGSSSSTKVYDIPATAHNKGKSQIGRLVGEEKFHSSEQQNFPDNLQFADDWLQDKCLVVEGMLDHLQESEHARRVSHDSAAVNNGRSVEVSRKSISGDFPPSDYRFANKRRLTPRSCPFPSTSQSDEPSVSENEVLTANAQGEHMKPGQFSESLSEKSTAADKFDQGKVNVDVAPRRALSPHRLFNAGLNMIRSSALREGSSVQHIRQTTISDNSCEDNVTSHSSSRRSITPHRLLSAGLNRIRNYSLREGSSGKEMKQTSCSDNLQEENAVCGSKSRHSPLMRRILDPLLKSKDQNQEFSTGDKMQIRVGLRSAELCRSSDVNIMISEAGCSVQAEKQVISTRQALVKLVWKSELPLFVFSANDDNILAATMGKGSISQKNNFNCIYTMFTANEVKKKGGVWKGQGNKNKKHDLAYNVAGQMRVSSIKSTGVGSNDCFVSREFVLLGSELATAHGCVNHPFNSELAAIVIRVPYESSDNINELHGNNLMDSSQINSAENKSSVQNLHIEQKNENSGLATVVAILPSGVHGISYTGEPSPLIERWKSGGSCDCGGWDEGCMLTILTDKNQVSRSSTSSQACSASGTDQIELFPQGENRESKHAFRMTFFKEGVYKVEFGASIALVQAFAICISVLHSRKPHTLSGLHYTMKAQSIQERTSTEHTSINCEKTQTNVPARYVPNCPPLSPVRRA